MSENETWILCPVCGQKTAMRVRDDTVATRMPVYCRKCKQESIVDIKNGNLSLSLEPDALTQSR